MKKFIILGLFILPAYFSCRKYVEKNSYLGLTDNDAIVDSSSADEAALGMYSALQLPGNYGIYQLSTPGLYSDELKSRSSVSDVTQLDNYGVLSTNYYVGQLWDAPYTAIYSANVIISRVPGVAGISDAAKAAFVAEAKFVRALSLFNILKFFGPTPLVQATDPTVISGTQRSSIADTYQFILNDLTAAVASLPMSYPGNGIYSGDQVSRCRATRAAAQALLARVYLYRAQGSSDWQNCINFCDSVIGNSTYGIEPLYSDAFKLFSKEAILEMFFQTDDPSRLALEFSPGSQWNYAASDQLVNGFESGDNRQSFLLMSSGGDYYSGKYVTQDAPAIVLRLGDIYLIRAEAEARMGDLPDARTDLNVIRSRAGLPANTETDATLLLADIAQERFIELAYEGHRFFDLVRTGEANQVLGALNVNWKATDTLLPLPFLEVSKGLPQNAGY